MKHGRKASMNPQRLRQDYLPGALMSLLVIITAILFYFLLRNFAAVAEVIRTICAAISPVFTGLILAYLLNPMVTFFEHRLEPVLRRTHRKDPKRGARAISAIITVALAIAAISSLCVLILPQVFNSVTELIQELPQQLNRLSDKATDFMASNSALGNLSSQLVDYIADPMEEWANSGTLTQPDVWLGYVASGVMGAFTLIYNVFVGLFISVYLLIGKERFLRQGTLLLFAVLKPHRAEWILKRMRGANKTFSTAILGKILDSLIIGMLCFIGMLFFDTPYSVLIAVIVGVTNVIPLFGPFIGAIPSVLILLMHDPMKALYFCFFLLALQQFDCNILDPKIVGGSIGLPAFWSIFACLLGGGLFGLFGMLIGVPTFAIFYNFGRELIEDHIRSKRLDPELLDRLGLAPPDPTDSFFEEEPILPDNPNEEILDSGEY